MSEKKKIFEKKETYVKHKSVVLNKKLVTLYVLIAILETLIPMTAITYGQSQNVPSSITGILMGTIPLFVILLSYFFYPKEEKKVVTLLSILVGFVGLIVLFLPKLVLNEQHSLMGECFILLGAFSLAKSHFRFNLTSSSFSLKLVCKSNVLFQEFFHDILFPFFLVLMQGVNQPDLLV